MSLPQLDIIFEDECIIAINKQSGMLVIPDRFRSDIPNLRSILSEKFDEIWIVHRLDKDTSGIVLFAKTALAHKILNEEFSDHTIRKTYIALLRGKVDHDNGTINEPLQPHPIKKGIMQVHPGGKESETNYKVRQRFRDYSLVEAYPLTGRQHQIRVHFASIEHSLAIDPLYGSPEPIFLSQFKNSFRLKNKNDEEFPLIDRLTLHAEKIEFTHPVTEERISIEAPMPKDFRAVVHQLERWNGI